jgi:cytochrome c oxidase cbb3-type subunit 3
MPAAAKTATAATSRRFLWIIPLLLLVAAVIGNVLRARADAAAVLRADPGAILADPRLRKIALDAGRQVFVQHCAACHGTAGKGDQQIGAPDLTDDDHLYGTGTVSQIEDIARYGIRAGNKRGWNLAVMPAYARRIPDAAEPLPPQTPAQIDTLVAFLHSFTAGVSDPTLVQRGRALYLKAGCWDCHGRDMGGDPAIGAPSLTDNIWLYGGRPEDIRRSLERGRAGVSPAFARTLTAAQLRNVAVYVASLAPQPTDPK